MIQTPLPLTTTKSLRLRPMPPSCKYGVPRDPHAPLRGTACKAGDFTLKPNWSFCSKFEGKLYHRMHSSDIYDTLTKREQLPPITHYGAPWSPPPGEYSDYCADFCCGQLLHYGLRPPKDKGQAMQKLLAAYGGTDGRTLDVPKSILQLQKAMFDSTGDEAWEEGETKPRKRTHSTSFGNDSPETKGRKRSKLPVSQMVNMTPKEWVKTMMFKRPKYKSETSISEVRDGIQSLKADEARQLLNILLGKSSTAKKIFVKNLSSAVKGAARSQVKALKAKEARAMLKTLADESASVEKILAKDLSLFVTVKSTYDPLAVYPSFMAGLYDIEAPSLDDPKGHTLELYPSSTESHFWASFDLGVVSGVLRSIYAPPSSLETEVHFEWRGRNSGENVISCGADNCAVITFLQGGLLTGKISVPRHGTFKIYGSMQILNTQRGAALAKKRDEDELAAVQSYKKMWRALNEHNHDIENTERWGKSGENPKDDQAFDSDTTIGKGKRSWKIDLKNFMRDPDTESDEDEDESSDEESSDEDNSEDEVSEEQSQDENSEDMSGGGEGSGDC